MQCHQTLTSALNWVGRVAYELPHDVEHFQVCPAALYPINRDDHRAQKQAGDYPAESGKTDATEVQAA
ncbi:hypothetical protein U875_05095 [Pandoraea pnomenusa 3kgm]|nr:hypothetical protein U875_05095 [Pandoraea pnomenusa 3kgm]AHN77607.1 hypothetical protein DA70_22170 [Pandoraea pnomenusa]